MEFKITTPPSSSDGASEPKTGGIQKRLRQTVLIVAARTVLVLLCACFIGYKVAELGFLEPDTCFILSLGRNIWENGAVPLSDPFSFTLPLSSAVGLPQLFVVHQWLFDLLVYFLYHYGALTAVAVVCAATASVAFICLPWRMCSRANPPELVLYAIIASVGTSILLRPFVRPEIASYLCLAIWLVLLQGLRIEAETAKMDATRIISWKTVAAFSLTMLIWCNMHTGFVTGLGILALFAFFLGLHDLSMPRKISPPTITALVSLLASSIATICNPSGIKLWQFVPICFATDRSMKVFEMQPIGATNLFSPAFASYFLPLFAPFFVLTAIALFSIAVYARSRAQYRLPLHSPIRLASVFMILVSIYCAFQTWRLIPFASLILALEAATLFGRSKPGCSRRFWKASPISVMMKNVANWQATFQSNIAWDCLPPATAALAVVLLANRLNVFCLPQVSSTFNPPFHAIQFLKEHPQSGPLFNEGLIGSMLTWYLPKVKVFIDSRFDEYGPRILADYQNILYLRRGALSVLDAYGIEWVFLEANQPLAAVLKKLPNWTVIYSDRDALIFRRLPEP